MADGVAFGAWRDKTSGQPVVENFSSKAIGKDGYMWITLQDKLGRLFVGGDQLHVYDGQTWLSFPVSNTYALRALAFGDGSRVWAGASNELGYFDEASLGKFAFHSLIQYLPREERLFGFVWSCAPVGSSTYFFCSNKILRWDGEAFRTWYYAGKSRLFPMSLNNEPWFHHLETGLYRVTESGPQLEVPKAMLPDCEILGLTKDAEGLLLVSAKGLFRIGTPPVHVSGDELNKFLADSRPACVAMLPNGNFAIGTVNKGIAIVARNGELLRIFDTTGGLPTRAVFSITPDAAGNAWCATPDGTFHIELNGYATLYGSANGLKGQVVVDLKSDDSRFFALTREGVFQFVPSTSKGGSFEQLPQMTLRYNDLLQFHGGLMLARHGGVDFFDGISVRPIFTQSTKTVLFSQPSRINPNCFYLSEYPSLGRLVAQSDGSFDHTPFLDLPDACTSLHEGPAERLWIGTPGKGAFTYDPTEKRLFPTNDPATGKPFEGRVSISGSDQQILFFHNGRVLMARPDGTGLRVLTGLPVLDFVATQPIPGNQGNLVAFNHPNATNTASQGVGLLLIDPTGNPQWQELDLPALGTIGLLRLLRFSKEDDRSILWIGGSEGLLRLNYDTISALKKPAVPVIRMDPAHSSRTRTERELAFSFQNHRLSFRVFIGDYTQSKDWLLQSRLGNGLGEWSASSPRRLFEFSNLSEGDYRFEVRTVNPAGLTSEPAVFAFRILPPWYRSIGAYAGYAVLFSVMVIIFISIRERSIRRHNQELGILVKIRTAELLKASAAKDEFLAGISHEIRNPMNGVIGIAETIRTEKLDADSRHKFGLLRQCASHLASLLEDILDFSLLQADAIELEAKRFELVELVASIAAITAAESEMRGIPVKIAVAPTAPAILTGDPRRIRQILLNFVGNALKFSGRGQVNVTVWGKVVGAQQTEVIFAVLDNGPGISLDEQKRLFTRFERGAAAQQGQVSGAGLGLALCKGLAEKMGGRIWLESEPGHGSCFYFSARFASTETVTPPSPDTGQSAIGLGQTALVVDDEEYNRIVLTDLLEALGFIVQSAADGPTALALARHQTFDMVCLDYDLPGMNGLETSRAIRALPNHSARALIVATTAFTSPEKRTQCTAAGMNAFLGKPVTMERLRKVLFTAYNDGNTFPRPVSGPSPATLDPLASLRLIAKRKGTSLAAELALYFSELNIELQQLNTALVQENAAAAGRYAHLLYGRCAFIAERQLEQTMRKLEVAGETGQWNEARTLCRSFETQLAGMQLRMASAAPVAPRGLSR